MFKVNTDPYLSKFSDKEREETLTSKQGTYFYLDTNLCDDTVAAFRRNSLRRVEFYAITCGRRGYLRGVKRRAARLVIHEVE